MERTMKKNTRRGLIVLLTLLVLGSAGLAAWWFIQPTEKETMVPVYTCTQQAQVDYQVFFAPNNFFPELTAGPGRAYITPLTQYIETVFNYSFSSDTPADISGQYQADAILTGYILKEKNINGEMEKLKIKAWEKSWALAAPTPFSAHDRTLEIKQPIPVDIRFYADFAEQVAKELKFSADLVELTVTYDVQSNVLTPQGQIKEPLKAIISIPIEGSTFMVQELTDKKEKSITKSVTEAVPGVKTARTGFAVATGLLALLLLLAIFKTTAEIEDPAEKELRRIIKKHGDRIVAGVFSFPAVLEKNPIVLHSFYDLIKVADEVAQPVLYENVHEEVHSFYVINEPLIYNFSLTTNGQKAIFLNENINSTNHMEM